MARATLRFADVSTLLIGSGLAVTVTGFFGLISARLAEPLAREQARCGLAVQIVTDETLNPALDRTISIKVSNDAARLVGRCMEDRAS